MASGGPDRLTSPEQRLGLQVKSLVAKILDPTASEPVKKQTDGDLRNLFNETLKNVAGAEVREIEDGGRVWKFAYYNGKRLGNMVELGNVIETQPMTDEEKNKLSLVRDGFVRGVVEAVGSRGNEGVRNMVLGQGSDVDKAKALGARLGENVLTGAEARAVREVRNPGSVLKKVQTVAQPEQTQTPVRQPDGGQTAANRGRGNGEPGNSSNQDGQPRQERTTSLRGGNLDQTAAASAVARESGFILEPSQEYAQRLNEAGGLMRELLETRDPTRRQELQRIIEDRFRKTVGGNARNIHELGDLLRRDALDCSGGGNGLLTTEDRARLSREYFAWTQSTAMLIQEGVSTDSRQANAIRDAAFWGTRDEARQIDNMLGVSVLRGTGEVVNQFIIGDPRLQKILRNLGERMGSRLDPGKLNWAFDKVQELEKVNTKEYNTVIAYLNDLNDQAFRAQRQAEIHPLEMQRGRDLQGQQFGTPENMNRVAPIDLSPQDIEVLRQLRTPEQKKSWMVTTFSRMSESPLFFASWWQSDVVERALASAGIGSETDDYKEVRDYAYGVFSVLGVFAVDRNADDNPEDYAQFLAPKNKAKDLHWDDDGVKFNTLMKDPVIRAIFDRTFDTAFDLNDGWRIVKAFSGEGYEMQDGYVRNLLGDKNFMEELRRVGAGDIGNRPAELLAKGRVALAAFEVDFAPEWVRYMHALKSDFVLGRGNQDVPWLDVFDSSEAVSAKRFVWNSKMQTTEVERNGQGERVKYELGFGNPRVLRPWDVMVFKGSYLHRPEIIWKAEAVLQPFIDRQTKTKDGREVRASKATIFDKYLKLNKALGEITGGPMGAELDNLTNWEKILATTANYWGASAHGNPEFAQFLVQLFDLKADALFYPGYPSQADMVLNRIRALDPYSGEKERSVALSGALGEKGTFAHGWVVEVKRLYGIDLLELRKDKNRTPVYPEFWNAYYRLFMDTPDVVEAHKKYQQAVRYLNQRRIATVAEGVGGVAQVLTKK